MLAKLKHASHAAAPLELIAVPTVLKVALRDAEEESTDAADGGHFGFARVRDGAAV